MLVVIAGTTQPLGQLYTSLSWFAGLSSVNSIETRYIKWFITYNVVTFY